MPFQGNQVAHALARWARVHPPEAPSPAQGLAATYCAGCRAFPALLHCASTSPAKDAPKRAINSASTSRSCASSRPRAATERASDAVPINSRRRVSQRRKSPALGRGAPGLASGAATRAGASGAYRSPTKDKKMDTAPRATMDTQRIDFMAQSSARGARPASTPRQAAIKSARHVESGPRAATPPDRSREQRLPVFFAFSTADRISARSRSGS